MREQARARTSGWQSVKLCQHGGYSGSEEGLGEPSPLGRRAGTRPQRVSGIALRAPSLQKVCSMCSGHKSCPEYYLETGLQWRTAAQLILGLCLRSRAGFVSGARRRHSDTRLGTCSYKGRPE